MKHKRDVKFFLSKLYERKYSDLSEEEKENYKKDKQHIIKYIDELNQYYIEHRRFIDSKELNISDERKFRVLLNNVLMKYDHFTIISDWVRGTANILRDDSFVMNNLDSFYMLLEYNERIEENYKDIFDLSRKISIEDVIKLTKEYLEEIDSSLFLVTEFEKVLLAGKYVIDSSLESSYYDRHNDVIYYHFDGSINDINTLLHEFIHRIHYVYGNSNLDRESFSIFFEYPSIFYENDFISFLLKKGYVSEAEAKTLKGYRFKNQYNQGCSKNFLKIMSLCIQHVKKGNISEDDIWNVIGDERSSDNFDEATKSLVEYCKDNYFNFEHFGLIMYKFSTVLASITPATPQNLQDVYKDAIECIIDRKSDEQFWSRIKKYFQPENFGKVIK